MADLPQMSRERLIKSVEMYDKALAEEMRRHFERREQKDNSVWERIHITHVTYNMMSDYVPMLDPLEHSGVSGHTRRPTFLIEVELRLVVTHDDFRDLQLWERLHRMGI